jgi:hypothetical protein
MMLALLKRAETGGFKVSLSLISFHAFFINRTIHASRAKFHSKNRGNLFLRTKTILKNNCLPFRLVSSQCGNGRIQFVTLV